MKPQLQEEYRDSDHWFFRARRRIFARVLDELVPLPHDARIVDLGPGSGVNIPVLRERGRVAVVDVARLSLRDCAAWRFEPQPCPLPPTPTPGLSGRGS